MARTNIVALNARKPKTYSFSHEVMNRIRVRMHEVHANDLAEMTGKSPACIYAIKSGRTKWPRGETLFAIMAALDISMRLIDLRTGEPF